MALLRIWVVTAAAAVVVVLGVLELVSSGRLSLPRSGERAPRDLSSVATELDLTVDAVLVRLGVSGVTSESEQRSGGGYTWTHRTKTGRLPHGISSYEGNLEITGAVRAAGGRVIRGGEAGPDWRGLKTLKMRIGQGDIETHSLVLHESGRSESDGERRREEGVPPRIAIVIDDLGYNDSPSALGILDLEYPLTVSVLPHCPFSATLATAAHRAGKEVLVHIPMEPHGHPDVDPGEGALMKSHTREQLTERIAAALNDVPHAAGANNHMGSLLTSQHIPMRIVMGRLRERGLYYLDSMTTPESVSVAEARRAGVPVARNRMFIDSPLDESGRIDIESQLDALVEIAWRRGSAVGIGHPHPETLRSLERELPRLEEEGVELVYVSQLVR